MAKTRLTQDVRKALIRFARKSAEVQYDRADEDKSRDKAEALVRSLVEQKFPPRDMKTLTKYGVAHHDDCIRLINNGGGVFVFRFRDEKSAPVVPNKFCSSRGFLATDEITALVDDIEKAENVRDQACSDLVADYSNVIRGARYAEDVKEIWPASSEILDEFIQRKGNAVVVADPEMMRRVAETNLGAAA